MKQKESIKTTYNKMVVILAEPTMNDAIQTQIDSTINSLPVPESVTLVKVYNDMKHGDIITDDEELLTYIPLIGGRTIGNNGVLIYIKNNYDNPVVIIDTV